MEDQEYLNKLRHSAAHLLAQAVKEIYPSVKLGIGPTIENGFYYDFLKDEPFTPEDLKAIEKKMKELYKKNLVIEKIELGISEQKKFLKEEPLKKELIKDLEKEGEKPTFYKQGQFIDLCKGPHLASTGEIKAFKLSQKVSAAYWKGDAKNVSLQRIYGYAFKTRDELKAHLKVLEEAQKRDHSKLGRELGLFVTSDIVGKGLPLLTPKGATIRRTLQRWIEDEEDKWGYERTHTPVLAKGELFNVSGHLDHYREDMFVFMANGEEMVLRPMTCPHQFMIYKSKMRSYRDLPIKYAECADLFRNEASGELHGLIRVRQFTLADAHIICLPEQVEEEFESVLNLVKHVMKTLGFDNHWFRFSKGDPNDKKGKYIDNPKAWKKSEALMKKILDKLKVKYIEVEGEAAFYGPKLDVQMKNVWGKEDTLFTIQIDFALPERFEMTYEGEDGKKHIPMVIHRSSVGCLERTMAMLIEKYAGKLPLWLSPQQVKIINVTDRSEEFAKEITQRLKDNRIRAVLDNRNETIGKKVRTAVKEKTNYILTIGDKEVEKKNLAVRDREGKVEYDIAIEDFIKRLKEEIETKKC